MAYSWSEYRCFMGGRFITGIRSFKYGSKRELEPIYGEGDEPVDVGKGNRSHNAELGYLQSELEAIIVAGGGDPFKIPPFDVVHSYINEDNPGLIINDVSEGCRFTEIEKAMKQGDKFMETTTPLFVMKNKYNVKM